MKGRPLSPVAVQTIAAFKSMPHNTLQPLLHNQAFPVMGESCLDCTQNQSTRSTTPGFGSKLLTQYIESTFSHRTRQQQASPNQEYSRPQHRGRAAEDEYKSYQSSEQTLQKQRVHVAVVAAKRTAKVVAKAAARFAMNEAFWTSKYVASTYQSRITAHANQSARVAAIQAFWR